MLAFMWILLIAFVMAVIAFFYLIFTSYQDYFELFLPSIMLCGIFALMFISVDVSTQEKSIDPELHFTSTAAIVEYNGRRKIFENVEDYLKIKSGDAKFVLVKGKNMFGLDSGSYIKIVDCEEE